MKYNFTNVTTILSFGVAIGAITLIASASATHAATKTFLAIIEQVYGDQPLLDELGVLAGGTISARFTFDTDQSDADIVSPGNNYDVKLSLYEDFSVTTPTKTIRAVTGEGANHRVITQDGFSEKNTLFLDTFEIGSYLRSTDEKLYDYIWLVTSNSDNSTWNRRSPITAKVLNELSKEDYPGDRTKDDFVFQKYIGAELFSIRSDFISYQEVRTAVPVSGPAALPLIASALFSLKVIKLRKRSRLNRSQETAV